ncbi:MAG: hypothetical protein ACE5KM_15135 [Planctomycetaceae bacterium]
MKERLKVFTFLSGTGATVITPALEDHVNEWLAASEGELVSITQSESERPGVGQHVTVCVWYVPPGDSRE